MTFEAVALLCVSVFLTALTMALIDVQPRFNNRVSFIGLLLILAAVVFGAGDMWVPHGMFSLGIGFGLFWIGGLVSPGGRKEMHR